MQWSLCQEMHTVQFMCALQLCNKKEPQLKVIIKMPFLQKLRLISNKYRKNIYLSNCGGCMAHDAHNLLMFL